MPEVFVSYSHDTDAHRDWVLALAQRLRGDGVTVTIDTDNGPGGPDIGWPQWSQRQAETAARIIVICTPRYASIYEGRQPPGSGCGAAAEAQVIRQYLYDQAQSNARVRVALVASADEKHIPSTLRAWHWFDLSRDAGYADMLSWLRSERGGSPAGRRADATTSAAPGTEMGFLMAVRLEVEVSRAEQLPAPDTEAEVVRWKVTRAAWSGRTPCDWSCLRAADLAWLAGPLPPAQRAFVELVRPPVLSADRQVVREQVRRLALSELKPWLDAEFSQTVDCMPAQLRALPEELRGPALALVVRQQTAGPDYELGVDSVPKSADDTSITKSMGIRMLSKVYPARFNSLLTREMLVREYKREQFLAHAIPLRDDDDVLRIARALGFRLQ